MVFCDGLLKGIQIDNDHINGGYVMRGQRLHVRRKISTRKNAAMHLGMQGLDTTIEHFRETGVVGDLGNLKAIVGQHPGRAASGQQLYVHGSECSGKFEHASFIGDGNKRLSDHELLSKFEYNRLGIG